MSVFYIYIKYFFFFSEHQFYNTLFSGVVHEGLKSAQWHFYHLLKQEKSIEMGGVTAVNLSAHLMSQHLSNSNLKM